MSLESRRVAGILLVVLPTVVYGGVSLLAFLINDPAYTSNPLRQDLWRAGHAHAGTLLLLSLVCLRYVDESHLSHGAKWFVRLAIPAAALFLPAAFFLSMISPRATEPNGLISLAYVGAAAAAAGVLTLGVGLLRDPATTREHPGGAEPTPASMDHGVPPFDDGYRRDEKVDFRTVEDTVPPFGVILDADEPFAGR